MGCISRGVTWLVYASVLLDKTFSEMNITNHFLFISRYNSNHGPCHIQFLTVMQVLTV